ncbi:MAG: fatty acyl-AMP ligase [Thermoanaerobaculia bacterium]
MTTPNPRKGHSRSLVELLLREACERPGEVLYRFCPQGEAESCEVLSYGELQRDASRLAGALRQLAEPGMRVLLLYPPGLDYIRAFFACLLAGMVAVPTYLPRPGRGLARLKAIAGSSGASLALAGAATAAKLSPFLPELRWLASDSIDGESPALRSPFEAREEDLAFLQYTSGSTGSPKGVEITHGNLLANLAVIEHCFGHSRQSVGVAWLPPYHDMGLIGAVLQPLYAGFPVVLLPPLAFVQRPLRWLQAVTRFRATATGSPNFGLDLCLRKITPAERDTLDLSSLTLMFTGAEPIHAETLERFASYFEPCGFRRESFYSCYGLAEATLMATGSRRGEHPTVLRLDAAALEAGAAPAVSGRETRQRELVSCGEAVPGHRLLVVDPESRRPLAERTVGEIWLAGPSVARGYWAEPEASRETFGATLAGGDGTQFLRTGDLGFLADGQLFVSGRRKDLIIVRGRNHYPQDIERTVETCHILLRRDAGAAFSVLVDGEERLVVAHEVDRQYRPEHRTAVLAAIREAIARDHELQVFAIALLRPASVARTSSGKIRRTAMREAFLAQTLDLVESHP